MIRKFTLLLGLLMIAGIAQADTANYSLAAGKGKSFAITIAPGTKLITVSTSGNGDIGKVYLLARPDTDFDFSKNLNDQAAFFSTNQSGDTTLSIADWSHPALHAGTWYFAVANSGTKTAVGTLTTTASTSSTPDSVFQINFAAPTADISDCDVAPWTDPKLMPDGKTTLGDFRKNLLKQAAANLASEIHSPIPIRVQACWKKFGDTSGSNGFTLAAAGPNGVWSGTPGVPKSDTWYSVAAAQRLAGTYICDVSTDAKCNEPDIVVRYNSDSVAQSSYDSPADEGLIISTTMHEMTHGLGFLSLVSLDKSDFGTLLQGKSDAFTDLVAYINGGKVTNYTDLAAADQKPALTSGTHLVLNDPELAANSDNAQFASAAPGNLVQLYAPSTISAGSTMSHFNDAAQPGQLMDHIIQSNHPSTLGLAEPVLESVGWGTGPIEPPVAGLWYDPAHSGHGIDLEPTSRSPNGDLYSVIFYTYSNSGRNEFYFSSGAMHGDHYEKAGTTGQPAPMARPVYDPATKKATYPAVDGALSIDFSSYAAAAPACAGHTGPNLAVMHWTTGSQSGSWCIHPLLGNTSYADAAHDLNGLWYGGTGDSGWGFSLAETAGGNGNHVQSWVYYFDNNNVSRWAQADLTGYQPGDTTKLYQPTGYGRLSPSTGVTYTQIGTLTLNINAPDDSNPPSGDSRISFTTDDGMNRTNVPVRLLSLPPGK